jgi:G6PDH family F420-dependent oxidoreductase
MRIHPAILAQATATTATMLGDRFTWGVGTGEALNEHILGHRWPPQPIRARMLEEALVVVRRLWSEDSVTHYGEYFTVEDARIFERPDSPVPLMISAFGTEMAERAAHIGDGLWITGAAKDTIDTYRGAGGDGRVYSQITLAWGEDRREAIDMAHRLWAFSSLPGQQAQDLRTVQDFEDAVELVTPEMVAKSMPCGPDATAIVDAAEDAIDAGVDHLYFHQIGPDQEGFMELWTKTLRQRLDRAA